MKSSSFSDDFKRDAVAQITGRGYPVTEVSKRLGVSQHSLYAWKRDSRCFSIDRALRRGRSQPFQRPQDVVHLSGNFVAKA